MAFQIAMLANVYFVSGIDTGIGKTVATGLMARWLAAQGVDAITLKLVQTGNMGFSEDIEEHRRICGGLRFPEDDTGLTSPQIFKFPSSPMLSASLEGKSVDYKDLSMAAIVRNGYYLGLSYKSENTFVIWRSGCDTVEFYDRRDWTLLESVQVSENFFVFLFVNGDFIRSAKPSLVSEREGKLG